MCALFAILDLALYIKYDGNNYHLSVCLWLSKVYSNSMLVVRPSPFRNPVWLQNLNLNALRADLELARSHRARAHGGARLLRPHIEHSDIGHCVPRIWQSPRNEDDAGYRLSNAPFHSGVESGPPG
jgi:hypothetical protein